MDRDTGTDELMDATTTNVDSATVIEERPPDPHGYITMAMFSAVVLVLVLMVLAIAMAA